MNRELLRKLQQQLDEERDLCAWASIYSMLTWNKIGFIRSLNRGRISETTLTQNLVFEFHMMSATGQLPIELFEAWDEAANGNDIEFFIEKEEGYVAVPIQAKLISNDKYYRKLNHRVSGTYQIDNLIEYAERISGIPLYLFYNSGFVPLWDDEGDFPDPEEFGCSIISAEYIKQQFCDKKRRRSGKASWKIPSFEDLHPIPALPFSQLFCGLVKEPDSAWPTLLNLNDVPNLVYYTYEEATDEDHWKNTNPPASISGIDATEMKTLDSLVSDSLENDNPDSTFNPKFRIIISKERQRKGGIYHLH